MVNSCVGQSRVDPVSVLEAAEYFRRGEPTAGVITRQQLLDPRCERHFKYKRIVEDERFAADAVFELSGSPCIYFKFLDDANPSERQLTQIRRMAWNHGLAPTLWVVTPCSVRIYNCYSRPLSDSESEHESHSIRVFSDIAANLKALNAFAGRMQVESGAFWRSGEARHINRRQRVDESLLQDLARAEKELQKDGLPVAIAHTLLGRSIFAAYLQDRGILSAGFFKENYGVGRFAELLKTRHKAEEFFAWIRSTFNGDLFPLSHDEMRSVKESHFAIVRRLLEGTRQSGQMRLWPYEFDIIPVELISSIYEMFTHSADGKIAEERSTHYTPVNLVDLVLSQVFDGVRPDSKVLDLSCGSGVFLVEAFRRLVSCRLAKGGTLDRGLIRDVLYNHVFGVDISGEAVQIAAFGLYLTLLEMDPDPQPPEDLRFMPLIGRNLFVADAFDEKADYNRRGPFAAKGFDVIVGNPPWTPTKAGASNVRYCANRGFSVARKGNPDQALLWRIGDFAGEDAQIGLILHANHFFSHHPKAREARKRILSRFCPKLMINLSDLRKDGLFPTASAPALVFIGSCAPSRAGDTFTLVSPKRSDGFRSHGIIEILPENLNRVSVRRAAQEDDVLKVASWGGARDMALIRRLRDSFPSLESAVAGCSCGQGFQKGGDKNKEPELKGKALLEAGEMCPYRIDAAALPVVTESVFHRPRDPLIYKAPLVVATRGLGKRGFFAAFCDSDVVYDSLYYGFSVPANLAHYLNGIMNSTLCRYCLFMMASVWGIERDEVQPVDLLRLPVPGLDAANGEGVERVIAATVKCENVAEPGLLMRCVKRLNDAVFDLYGLDRNERILVEDAATYIIKPPHSKRDAARVLQSPEHADLVAYANCLIGEVGPLLAAQGQTCMVGEIFDVGRAPVSCIRFRVTPAARAGRRIKVVQMNGLGPALDEIARLTCVGISDVVYSRRVVRAYAGDCLYVLKPSQMRYWTGSAALRDADEILEEHLEFGDDPGQ